MSDQERFRFEIKQSRDHADLEPLPLTVVSKQPDPIELTALHAAISAKDLKQVNVLVRNGVDVNALHSNFDLGFPLSHALGIGDKRIIKALLAAGAYPNRADHLAECIEGDELAIAKLLIQYGADLDCQPTWEKYGDFETNLIRAARAGKHAFVKLLLEAGANANRHDGNNESALLVARMEKNRRLVKLIMPYVSAEEQAWVDGRFSKEYAAKLKLDGEIHEAIHAGEVDQVVELLTTSKHRLDGPLQPEFGCPLEEALRAYYKAVNNTRPKQRCVTL